MIYPRSSVVERLYAIIARSPVSLRTWLRTPAAKMVDTSPCKRDVAGSSPAGGVGGLRRSRILRALENSVIGLISPHKVRGCGVVVYHDKISAIALSRVSVA